VIDVSSFFNLSLFLSIVAVFFFFSSRRRHTRSKRDWSSDVCSSDLPLFIYGGVGLGKTHLMHAIGHYAHELYPDMRILYITSEDFTNQLVSAMQTNQNQQFRERFRNVDILMVDDIQVIAGKHGTEEEFFHTFNHLREAGKQIAMTSDKPPKESQKLEERLCSRLEGGLVADSQRPDFGTRLAGPRNKAEF